MKIAKHIKTKHQSFGVSEILPSSATRFATKLGSGCCAFTTPGRELAARPPEILGTKLSHHKHCPLLSIIIIYHHLIIIIDFGKSFRWIFWRRALLPLPCPGFRTRNSTLHRVASSSWRSHFEIGCEVYLSLMLPKEVALHLKMMLEFLTIWASFWANLKGSKRKISRSSLISHLSSQRESHGWHGAVGLCLEPKEALKQHIDSPHISGKYHQASFMAICCDVVLIHSSLSSAIDVILDKHNFLKDLPIHRLRCQQWHCENPARSHQTIFQNTYSWEAYADHCKLSLMGVWSQQKWLSDRTQSCQMDPQRISMWTYDHEFIMNSAMLLCYVILL